MRSRYLCQAGGVSLLNTAEIFTHNNSFVSIMLFDIGSLIKIMGIVILTFDIVAVGRINIIANRVNRHILYRLKLRNIHMSIAISDGSYAITAAHNSTGGDFAQISCLQY